MTDNNPSGPKENSAGGDQPTAKEHNITAAINAFEAKYEAAQADNSKNDSDVLLWTKRAAKGVFVYTALTVVIACASIYGTILTRKSLSDVQRAFITVTQLEIQPRIIGNQLLGWTINPIVENSGTTAPRNLFYVFGFGNPSKTAQKLRDPIDFPSLRDIERHKNMKAMVMGPQSKISNFTTLNGFTVSSLLGKDLEASTGEFVWGALVYGDVFAPEAKHITEFCFIMDRTTLVENKTVPYERCDHHNCTDDDCK